MKTIIAGSRICLESQLLFNLIDGWHKTMPITEVISGCCKGVDRLGEMWAKVHGIPIKKFPANWDLYGKAAGPMRNQEMADYADCLIALCFDNSRGTLDMIKKAKEKKLQTLEIHLNEI